MFYNGRCTFIFRLEVGKPCVRAGIGRHAPVATRTKRTAANLRPIGQARTLELLGEETAEEGAQPFENNLIGVRRAIACAVKCTTGKIIDLLRTEAETQHIIQEEVVKLVRADKVLCHLLDIAVLVSRNEFGTDGGVYYIEQCGAAGLIGHVACGPAHEVLYERFGYGGDRKSVV